MNRGTYNWIDDALFLISYGADPNTRDEHGKSLLHRLIPFFDHNLRRIPQYHMEPIVRLVTQYHVDIDIQDATNQTPLQSLINQYDWSTDDMLFLVAYGANPNTQDAQGKSLLHKLICRRFETDLAERNKEAIIRLITLYKANIHIQDA
jgi:ankyrin repeat protein